MPNFACIPLISTADVFRRLEEILANVDWLLSASRRPRTL